MSAFFDIFETDLGWMGAIASERGLRRTTLPQPDPATCAVELASDLEGAVQDAGRFEGLKSKIDRYFAGEPVTFEDEALDVEDATPFFRAAWAACRGIPRGSTENYGWLAAQSGSPAAARAAGQAMARNRMPIIVPCHRVIAGDGGLGGFGKGKTRLPLKRQLLALESNGAGAPQRSSAGG